MPHAYPFLLNLQSATYSILKTPFFTYLAIMGNTKTQENANGRLLPILAINFINTLSYSIILPFLIILVTRFGGNSVVYGLIGATYSGFQLFGAPILGGWSDEFGRRRILILSQIGTFIAWCIFIIALLIPERTISEINSSIFGIFTLTVPLILLFVARAFDGLTGGNISVANAYLADISTEKDRKANFGKMAAAANMGFIFGPVIAGLLGGTSFGELIPVSIAALISLIAIFLITYSLKESTPKTLEEPAGDGKVRRVMGQEHRDCQKIKCKKDKLSFWQVLQLPNIRFLFLLYKAIARK